MRDSPTPQEAYFRLMAAALDAARDFTSASGSRQLTVKTIDGEVRMNRLADLFEGVTNELILAGGGAKASLKAIERVREAAQSSDELARWVDAVFVRYGCAPWAQIG